LLHQSDFVSLHVPLLPATRHLIDKKRLAVMKNGAVLLNFARDALVGRRGRRCGTARASAQVLPVRLFPALLLLGEPGVVALPHLGASTAEAEENCAVMVVNQVREFLENGTIANAVNFPNVEMPRESPYRVAIANANVPNMLGQISTTMAKAGLNIHNMVNKSRGEMAYTLVDVDSPVSDAVVAAIDAIDGVLIGKSDTAIGLQLAASERDTLRKASAHRQQSPVDAIQRLRASVSPSPIGNSDRSTRSSRWSLILSACNAAVSVSASAAGRATAPLHNVLSKAMSPPGRNSFMQRS
jgi:hypothetical protein